MLVCWVIEESQPWYLKFNAWFIKNLIIQKAFFETILSFLIVTDYPWRTAAQPLTSNVIKWFFLPDFAMSPNPSFIFCEFILASFLFKQIFPFLMFAVSFRSTLQTTTCCCSARPFSGRSLKRRTERRCDCWPETTWRSAEAWTPAPSTSSYLSITSFIAGQKC